MTLEEDKPGSYRTYGTDASFETDVKLQEEHVDYRNRSKKKKKKNILIIST